ncbi:MAG TPA: hypothetical protein VEQ61_02000, partial [Thermoleophilaceae bacterium]|nr:hypothetical protein [Thermoleophilaceae bacterium]
MSKAPKGSGSDVSPDTEQGSATLTAPDRRSGPNGYLRAKVDEAHARTPAGPEAELSEDQRVLLGDLYAVIQEHADEAAEAVDLAQVE